MSRTRLFATAAVILLCVPVLPAEAPKRGRKVALLVAVQDYAESGLSNLKYCENDVNELAKVLKGQGYQADDIIVLTDAAAAQKGKLKYVPTAEHVRRELKGLIEDLRTEDTFLVAFSGHGVHLKALKEKGLHFCAKGCNLDKPETMVALGEVYEQLEKNCKAELKLMFVDACRNDPADGKSGPDARMQSETMPLIPDPPGGIVAFFSCSTGQKSYESDALKHGIFFHHVIQGLKGGPSDDPISKKGEITVPLLEDYLTRAVPTAVKKDKDDRSLRQVPERVGKLRGSSVLGTVGGYSEGEEEYTKARALGLGIGVKIDAVEAVRLYRKAADLGHPLASVSLAGFYNTGSNGVPLDRNKAKELTVRASKRVIDAATRGEIQAVIALGWMYHNGYGVPKDEAEALKWYRKAADKGDAVAMCKIGYMYQEGQGVPIDFSEAIKWLIKASEKGSPEADSAIGVMCVRGEGVAVDYAKAILWFRKAAERNHCCGINHLGWIYDNGAGVPRDVDEATKWYRKAHEQGCRHYVERHKELGIK